MTIAHNHERAEAGAKRCDELLRLIARVKLRLEVSARRERTPTEYRNLIANCLDDVDGVIHAANLLASRNLHPVDVRMKDSHEVE